MTRRRAPPPPPPGQPEGDEDPELARALPDVQKLPQRPRVPAAAAPPPRAPAGPAARPAEVGPGLLDLPDDPGVRGAAPGLDPKVLRRLGRGEPPIEDELDLHGKDREAAARAVRSFLGRSLASGRRCVRIVHGRGLHSAEGPILRTHVARVLQAAVHDGEVLAFTPAPPSAGGPGAVHVLLRIKRR